MEKLGFGDKFGCEVKRGSGMKDAIKFGGKFEVVCVGADGKEKWRDEFENMVVDTGVNAYLDAMWKGNTFANFYVGLKGSGTVSAGDTMASHSGWSEITDYSESARPALVMGSVSNKSVDNSANKATFSINATVDVYGAFITTDSTKGGTAGTLISAGDFASAKSVSSGDTLYVQYTATGQDV